MVMSAKEFDVNGTDYSITITDQVIGHVNNLKISTMQPMRIQKVLKMSVQKFQYNHRYCKHCRTGG